ncbi:hypothetical protein BofuT4_uP077340.1 [Botrytis cinerea T4]|uniref:Uncharacterized protein n=1 Tax=Botryotinia fuckeliana (strain T4) TaxID=999810 RepID=G2YLE3_BOTF4|nr:hypothetical protein BofuT4_uP077340.1 [Botrytis cinerea T4]
MTSWNFIINPSEHRRPWKIKKTNYIFRNHPSWGFDTGRSFIVAGFSAEEFFPIQVAREEKHRIPSHHII